MFTIRLKNIQRGFTLIEMLITVTVLAAMSLTINSMLSYSLKLSKEKGFHEEALAIANEKIEFFRSLNYNIVGTPATNCKPAPCTMAPTEILTRNNVPYTVNIDIRLIDSPFDNENQNPEGDDETGVNDYKQARIEISWPSTFTNHSIILTSSFAPVGIETGCTSNYGVLKLTVFDANVQPVPQANVYIKTANLLCSSAVDCIHPPYTTCSGNPTKYCKDTNGNKDPLGYTYNTKTNNAGVLRIGCLTPSASNDYQITINKSGVTPNFYNPLYSTAQTCPYGSGAPDPICPTAVNNVNPTDLHLNILDTQTTEKSFAIDKLSVLNVKTVSQNLPDEWVANQNLPGDQDMPIFKRSSGDDYYLFWRDGRTGSEGIYGQKYDSSKAFQWDNSDVKLSNTNNQTLPSIDLYNDKVYITATHDSNGNQEVYITKRDVSNGNLIWNKDLKDFLTSLPNSRKQTSSKINLPNTNNKFFYLTFLDDSNDIATDTNDIYTVRINNEEDDGMVYCSTTNSPCSDGNLGNSCDNGNGICKKWPNELKINDDSGTNIQAWPTTLVETGSDNLYIFWHDNRTGNYDIYGEKIDSNGVKLWTNNVKINDTNDSLEQSYPAMAMSDETGGKFLYVVWQDFRNGTDYDIYLAKYDTDGNRVNINGTADFKVTNNSSDQTKPTIAITPDNNKIYIAWTDKRNGANGDIYLQRLNIDNSGMVMADWSNDIRINNDTPTATSSNPSVQDWPQLITNSNNEAVIAWQDNDRGDYDIKVSTYKEPDPIINKGNVPLKITGTDLAKLLGTDNNGANIYKFDQTFTTDANGDLKFNCDPTLNCTGGLQSKLEWNTYNFAANGGNWSILRSEPPFPIVLSPDDPKDITLTVKQN